ncbi:Bromodomain-containing protein [Echria macrotheca]|uniref:Bromodomain-containing protein n=1 Tax=Echria macrotheca TaxID=438768 RepID=A0AAJ0F652_9PEZI|nr:Bromodomain-containing protein [Echria macrotheca]
MDNNKRKAASSVATGITDGDDRAAKRRKIPGPPTDYDLSKGESYESTTSYGLHFLEMIRRTKDKNGRTVADYFENLLPQLGNEHYYSRIRMPISLKTIEHKLHNQEFANLSELESYFKRMVTNAKEYYSKGSEVFEDAERVRKALSNYMTKTNPAYKLIPGYSCQAAPIPEDLAAEGHRKKQHANVGDEDADGDDDADGKGDDDADGKGDDDDDDDGEDEDGGSSRKSIVLKKKSQGKSRRHSSTPVRRTEKSRGKTDHEYEGVPYKGLTFQQAQEKIVEELIRKPDGPDPYFLDFINLPARSYRDYFAVIDNPLSLKGLQKQVKGVHGRQPATGISDFKSWAAFEERARLLWDNAHFYNEEGSVIYNLATKLKECFENEVKEAKAVVQEPPQPKIKLKVPPAQETTPAPSTKKITIHVAKSSGAPSPALPSGQSSDSSRVEAAPDMDRALPLGPATGNLIPQHPQHSQIDKARSFSGPPPGTPMGPLGHAGNVAQPLAMAPKVNGATFVHPPNGVAVPGQAPHPQQGMPVSNGHHPAQALPPPIYDNKVRAPGRGLADALIQSVLIRTLYGVPVPPERRFRLEILAHPTLAQQNLTVHIPANQYKLQIIPKLAPLEQQQRHHRLFVTMNGHLVSRGTPTPAPDDPLPPNALVFEVGLQPGTSVIVITLVSALPKGEKLPNGSDCELERITINAHLSKFSTS